jgi:hypothetical protein
MDARLADAGDGGDVGERVLGDCGTHSVRHEPVGVGAELVRLRALRCTLSAAGFAAAVGDAVPPAHRAAAELVRSVDDQAADFGDALE